MQKITKRVMAAAAVAAMAVVPTAPAAVPAMAAQPAARTIQYGGYLDGTNVGSVIGFTNATGTTLECTSLTASGGNGPYPTAPPVVFGTVTGDLFTLDSIHLSSPGQPNDWCVTNGSIPTQVTVNLLKFNETGVGPNTIPGQFSDLKIELHSPSVPCDATIGGPGPNGSGSVIEGSYTNPSTLTGNDGVLSVPFGSTNNLEVLSVSSATDCAGLISVGETVSLAGTIQLTRTSPVPPPAGISPTVSF